MSELAPSGAAQRAECDWGSVVVVHCECTFGPMDSQDVFDTKSHTDVDIDADS